MKSRYSMILVFVALTLVGVIPGGTIAQDPPAGMGPEWGMSTGTGASMRPDALPDIPASEEEVPPRGYEFDLATLKALVPPSGQLPEAWEDQSVFKEERHLFAPALATSFQGLTYTGSFPPDTVIAAGPNHVIQAVNRSFRISTKAGVTVSTHTFSSWWSNVITGVSPFDPKVLYDQHSSRWVLLTVARNTSTSQSWYLISTSHTSDPTGQWCVWALEAHVDGSFSTTYWADYPQLGVDNSAIYITSNQFSFSTPQTFQYCKIRIMGKNQFYSNTCGAISWYDGTNMMNADGTRAFTMQPAHTFGTPGREFIINSRSGSGSNLTLWSITNPLAAKPTFTLEATISVGSYSAPPDATQSGSAEGIDTGDARLLNAVYRDGKIYTAHSIDFSGDARCGYYVIDVSVPTAPVVKLDVAFGATGLDYFFPAVMPDGSGNFVTVFSRSGPSEFAGCRYTVASPTFLFDPSSELRAGANSYVLKDSLGRNRWGDYNGAGLDPSNANRVWISSQYAAATQNTWSTWIGEVPTTSANPRFDITMSKLSYVNGDTITASEFRPQNPRTTPTAVKIRIWFKVPTLGEIDLINIGADGSFFLPANLNVNAGPLALIPVGAAFPPKGNWEWNARLTNPTTGALFSEDINPFVVQ